jgi:chromosome segregation ATPase
MEYLNIFQHPDGTTAWDTLLIIALSVLAGWLWHRFNSRRSMNKESREALAEHERNYKRVENEYKNYRSNIHNTEKHNDKAVIELNSRVKALEGDIRALADEKKKVLHQFAEKEQEIRKYMLQVGEREDTIKVLREGGARTEEDWAEKLRTANHSLAKATVWEDKVRAAEADGERARDALGQAERKRLEAELRLKAVSEYAGKIGPLENDLAARDRTILDLQDKLRTAEEITQRLNEVSAELQSLKTSWQKM